jgi:acyl carrier protein
VPARWTLADFIRVRRDSMAIGTDALLSYMRDELDVDTARLDIDSPLFSSGIIDSFSLVSLLAYIEAQHHFRIPATDVTLDNFDTIGRIAAYVSRMTATPAMAG